MAGPVAGPMEILVCATCRGAERLQPAAGAGASPEANDASTPPRPGAILLERLSASELPDGVRVRAVECLSNCKRGCTVAFRGGAERWTYVYGDLDPDTQVEVLLDGACRYRDAPQGLVPWRERAEHFRKHCIARVPPIAPPGAPSTEIDP